MEMIKRGNVLFFTVICLMPIIAGRAQKSSPITAGELRKHVEYLSSQEFKGRYPGTPGDASAANYIRNCFTGYGLKQFSEQGFQSFKETAGIKKGAGNLFSINGKDAVSDKEFTPVSISENGRVNESVVFLGYGFRIKSGQPFSEELMRSDKKVLVLVQL